MKVSEMIEMLKGMDQEKEISMPDENGKAMRIYDYCTDGKEYLLL